MRVKKNFTMRKKNVIILIAAIGLNIFQLSAQTNWTKYGNGPVLKRDTVIADLPHDLYAISDCWVMKEGNTYKMWYTCGGLNYPADSIMRSRLCYSTSLDGITWTKYSSNPILDVSYTGGWDSLGVETATVIIDSAAPSSEKYKMWYAGQYFNSYRYDIGYAFSADGVNWTKHPSPVLQVGTSTQWDNGFIEGPSVIKDGNTYKMWYCGYDATVDGSGTDGKANIGYATSTDGINWIKNTNNPILSAGVNSWDSMSVQDPHVIKQGAIYYMWFGGNNIQGYGQSVGYATSNDGINWVESSQNPVLTKGNVGAWDANTASFPSVLNDNGIYKMWYTGKDVDPPPTGLLNYYWEIGYATSPATGIDENSNSNNKQIILFPNPTQNALNIEVAFDLKNAELKIYNEFGQLEKSISNLNARKIKFETLDLPNGLYFLMLQNSDNIIVDKFFISK